MSYLSITMRSVMQEIEAAAAPLNECLRWQAEMVEAFDFDFSCKAWAEDAYRRAAEQDAQQQAEIRAGTNIPQHLVW